MGLGPGNSIQVHIEVNPVTVGCPQQVNPTVNRLPPAHKASIHSRPGLLLLAGPCRSARGGYCFCHCQWDGWEGKHTERESPCRPGDILDCVWHVDTKPHNPPTSLALAQWPYGVPEHLNTYGKEIRLPLTMMTKLHLSQSHMGIQSALHTGGGVHTCVHTHVCSNKGWNSAQRSEGMTPYCATDSQSDGYDGSITRSV